MTVAISLLRAVNVGRANRISMAALRAIYESLGVRNPQTYLQSGNVVFQSDERRLRGLHERVEREIERNFGFRTGVIGRTAGELRDVVARSPFPGRRGIEPNKLLVVFLASDPGAAARGRLRGLEAGSEELQIHDRELYIYFPDGLARPKLSVPLLEKTLGTSGTGRNWNTVRKLAEFAQKLDFAL